MGDLTVTALAQAASALSTSADAHKTAAEWHRRRARQARRAVARIHQLCAEQGIDLIIEDHTGQEVPSGRPAGHSRTL